MKVMNEISIWQICCTSFTVLIGFQTEIQPDYYSCDNFISGISCHRYITQTMQLAQDLKIFFTPAGFAGFYR